jgi:hypothetical protein
MSVARWHVLNPVKQVQQVEVRPGIAPISVLEIAKHNSTATADIIF